MIKKVYYNEYDNEDLELLKILYPILNDEYEFCKDSSEVLLLEGESTIIKSIVDIGTHLDPPYEIINNIEKVLKTDKEIFLKCYNETFINHYIIPKIELFKLFTPYLPPLLKESLVDIEKTSSRLTNNLTNDLFSYLMNKSYYFLKRYN